MKRLKEIGFSVLIVASMVASLFCINQIATARALPPGCQDDLWWTLQATRRLICDGKLFEDGHWNRLRVFYTPAHHVPLTTNCYGYSYISCTTTGGYDVAYHEASNEIYIVTPDTVLPDEPGYLGDATLSLPQNPTLR